MTRQPLAFSCEDVFAALLGSFDGRDRRTLHTQSLGGRPEQLLVSIHEQLHEELHWSTAWGLVAAMAGLLHQAGHGPNTLGAAAVLMNNCCREVHELFATTISCGAVGIPQARELLAGNALYLQYLEDGLALGGPAEQWPWQFRESAVQMLLRTLMQPVELIDVAEHGLAHLRESDVTAQRLHPDVRLQAVKTLAAEWWQPTFAEVLDAHPQRGGDNGGLWARELPEDAQAMERLKAWEETVLIPALAETARAQLATLGIEVLTQDEYLGVVEALRTSFLQLAPPDWQVEVFRERRLLHEEMLGAEREALMLADSRARVTLCQADELPTRATEFLLSGSDTPTVLALLLDRAVLHRQFAGIEEIPHDGPPLLTMAGTPVLRQEQRQLPMALMRPDVTPATLGGMFSSLPVVTLSSLRSSLHDATRDALLDLREAYVLVDLPLRTQIASWIEQTGHVRLRLINLDGPRPMNLIVLQPEGLPSLWMLAFRSDAGVGEIAQLLDRHSGHLTTDLDIPTNVVHRVGMLAGWLHQAWYALEEIPA
jgi:hypothetical protein